RKDIGIRDFPAVQSHGVVLGLHISGGKDRVCRQMLLLLHRDYVGKCCCFFFLLCTSVAVKTSILLLHRDYGEMLLVLVLQIINPNSRCKEGNKRADAVRYE
ncbi:hypothetical protein SUGI_0385300, partial [Cryptomeria japonica]